MTNNYHISGYMISLREQLRKLRIELLFLLNQWYVLKSVVYPEVKHKYRNIFGDLILELDEKKITANQMNTRVRDIIHSLNSHRKISKSYVVNTYNMSFKSSEINVISDDFDLFDAVSKEFSANSKYDCTVNNEYETAQLYRQIVKKVHPDLNGENETFNKYWNNILDSYQTSNLTRLRLFHKLICEEIPDNFIDNKIEENFLKMEIREFEKSIRMEKLILSRVKAEEPFCYEGLLDDNNWIKYKRNMLAKEIKLTDQVIERNKSLLKNILDKHQDYVTS